MIQTDMSNKYMCKTCHKIQTIAEFIEYTIARKIPACCHRGLQQRSMKYVSTATEI